MPTLLVSDDNVIVQRMIAMTFAAENIAVTAVSDGEQAIARIAKERPDIVLAGTTTPRRTGYDVAAFVKSAPQLASIPVLLLAGAFEPVDEVRAAQVRCDGVLVKPLEPSLVVARVKDLLAQTAERPSAPQATASTPSESLDDYFERLDAAFAHRSGPVPPSRQAESGVVPTLETVLNTQGGAPGSTSGAEPSPVVTDALVDEVTKRVVERLGSQALKDVVADLVGEIAERLIRQEIARIRSK